MTEKVGSGNCGHGVSEPAIDGGEQASGNKPEGLSPEQAQQQLEQIAHQLAEHERSYPGTIPGGVLMRIEEILKPPTIPWQNILNETIYDTFGPIIQGARKYTYAEPSSTSRALMQATGQVHYFRPKRYDKEIIGAIIVDTSGSMTEDELRFAIKEVESIVTANDIDATILATDTETHIIDNYTTDPLIGGGGTDMREGLRFATEELDTPPDVIVIITDGETPWPKEDNIAAPVIAVVINDDPEVIDDVPDFFTTVSVSHTEDIKPQIQPAVTL
jgi:predicted metal-dependent peptidase